MPLIQLPQKNKTIEVVEGKNLMDALLESGLPVASSCHGQGICSKCAVTMNPEGNHTQLELQTLDKNKISITKRLSCQVFVTNNISVETSYW